MCPTVPAGTALVICHSCAVLQNHHSLLHKAPSGDEPVLKETLSSPIGEEGLTQLDPSRSSAVDTAKAYESIKKHASPGHLHELLACTDLYLASYAGGTMPWLVPGSVPASRLAQVRGAARFQSQVHAQGRRLVDNSSVTVTATVTSASSSSSSAAAAAGPGAGVDAHTSQNPPDPDSDVLTEILLGASTYTPSEYHTGNGFEIDLLVLDVRPDWNRKDPIVLMKSIPARARRHTGQHTFLHVQTRRLDQVDMARSYPAMWEKFLEYVSSDPNPTSQEYVNPQFPLLNALWFNRRMLHAYHNRAIYLPALLAMQEDYRAGRVPESALRVIQLSRPCLMSGEIATVARHLNPHGIVDELSEWFLFSQPPRCERVQFDPQDWSQMISTASYKGLAIAEARSNEGLPTLPDPALLLEPGHYHRNSPNRIAPYASDDAHTPGLIDAIRARAYLFPRPPTDSRVTGHATHAATSQVGLDSSSSSVISSALYTPSSAVFSNDIPAPLPRWLRPESFMSEVSSLYPDLHIDPRDGSSDSPQVAALRHDYTIAWARQEAAAVEVLSRRIAIGAHRMEAATLVQYVSDQFTSAASDVNRVPPPDEYRLRLRASSSIPTPLHPPGPAESRSDIDAGLPRTRLSPGPVGGQSALDLSFLSSVAASSSGLGSDSLGRDRNVDHSRDTSTSTASAVVKVEPGSGSDRDIQFDDIQVKAELHLGRAGSRSSVVGSRRVDNAYGPQSGSSRETAIIIGDLDLSGDVIRGSSLRSGRRLWSAPETELLDSLIRHDPTRTVARLTELFNQHRPSHGTSSFPIRSTASMQHHVRQRRAALGLPSPHDHYSANAASGAARQGGRGPGSYPILPYRLCLRSLSPCVPNSQRLP